ncbi:MAG: hypothetical protein NE328_23065 [Lentisphaeraceae bacterium]|nr:hypothetical protein [Lentisphaeraceae bacterium]
MLKYLLIISILFTTSYGQKKKIPSEVSIRIYIGSLIKVNNLSNDPKYSTYYSAYVRPIIGSEEYYKDYYKVLSDLGKHGSKYYTSKEVYGTYRELLTTQEVLILLNLAIFEKLEKDFIAYLKKTYLARMEKVAFSDDEVSISNKTTRSSLEFNYNKPIKIDDSVTVTFSLSKEENLEVVGNSRRYINILKNITRYLGKASSLPSGTVEVLWKPSVQSLKVSPIEIYAYLVSPRNCKSYLYFGDFSYEGEVRSWGYMRDSFEKVLASENKIVFFPISDFQDIKEYYLIFGKNELIKHQFIGIKKLEEVDRFLFDSNSDWQAIRLYKDILEKVKLRSIQRNELLTRLDEVLKIQPNHISAKIYKDLLHNKHPNRLSLMNSFFEFERLYRMYKAVNYFDSSELVELKLEDQINKILKIAHPKISIMLKGLKENIQTANRFKAETNNSIKKGLRQKIFKTLRVLNQKRDILLDDQASIDRIYVK